MEKANIASSIWPTRHWSKPPKVFPEMISTEIDTFKPSRPQGATVLHSANKGYTISGNAVNPLFTGAKPMLYSGCARVRRPAQAAPTRRFWRSTIAFDKRSAKSFIRINDRIRAREIRVIDENGEQLGILPPFEALKIARERGLDLVEVSPTAVPPVCRIQDYGRFLYEKEKSERAARKRQKVITVKEVKFSVTVDEHDYQTKKNQAVRFLSEGDKVKASLRFRGRQMTHRELGYKIINRLIQDIGDAGIVEFMPRMEGTVLHAILAPAKKQDAPKPKPAAAAQAS